MTHLSLAGVIVPDLAVESELRLQFWEKYEKLILGLDPGSVQKIAMLTKAIAFLSWVYYFRSVEKLSSGQKDQFIERLLSFPVSKIAGGVTGLRSLVLIAFYSLPEVWEEINYAGPLVNNPEI